MTGRSTLALLLLSVTPALAAEELQAHATAPRKSVILGRAKILPDALVMKSSEVLQFENLRTESVTVHFIQPKNQVDKIRCEYLAGEQKAPWLLFTWDWEKRLVATVPPGRMASVCSFAPGEYVYTVEPTYTDTTGGPPSLSPIKGTISVE